MGEAGDVDADGTADRKVALDALAAWAVVEEVGLVLRVRGRRGRLAGKVVLDFGSGRARIPSSDPLSFDFFASVLLLSASELSSSSFVARLFRF